MITTTDVANILFLQCQCFDMPVYQAGNIDNGEIEDSGRVVIHVKEMQPEIIWRKGIVEVNLFIRDTKSGKADLIRLNELERMAHQSLKSAGHYDGTFYRYDVTTTIMLEERELKAHYINAKVLFSAINTME